MSHQSKGLYNSAYLFVSIILLFILPTLAHTVDIPAETNSFPPAAKPPEAPDSKKLKISLDEAWEFEIASEIMNGEPEVKSNLPELRQLSVHEQESHRHLHGEIMFNDDASVRHPSLHDIEGFEIDITIDFD